MALTPEEIQEIIQISKVAAPILIELVKAGQVKLLTDNNKFYQDEYFKLKYECEILQKRNKELEDQIKKIPFSKFFKKI